MACDFNLRLAKYVVSCVYTSFTNMIYLFASVYNAFTLR